MRSIGTLAYGVRTPIIRENDDLSAIVAESVKSAAAESGRTLRDHDIVAVTEAVVARAQGNYATIAQVSADVAAKFPEGEAGVVLPIFSRNRFSMQLRGIAGGLKKLYLQLGFPSDEVGNMLITYDDLDAKKVNPYSDSFTESEFIALFGAPVHKFTGVNYIEYYKSLSDNIEVVFSNDPAHILKYTPYALACDIHTRARTKRILKAAGAKRVLGQDDLLTESVQGSGYNPDYGLLGSNKAGEERLKLFPRDCGKFVNDLKARLDTAFNADIEVLIYGDGAFKDPIGGIWELADPVVSPAFTPLLGGLPNEIKIKYIADNKLADLSGAELEDALKKEIRSKNADLMGKADSLGTTPRHYSDLLGSLSDLISGSGDKGTPVVVIQNYFDNYSM
ncbi:MAG: coenzyme F420-0:L-glutamate ligase [Oscillospiraceae bacterium]|nr:coenzyme F420-0:L-glutamate ligase [Oscillospiraceae bacterium]